MNFNYLISTTIEDSNDLEILQQVDKIRTDEVDERISDMLDRINKLRLIHEQSRKWHEKEEAAWEDPRAIVFISPVPGGMGNEALTAALSVYGRVHRVDKGDNDRASVQFASLDQARVAARALRRGVNFLGENVQIWLREEEQADRAVDTWAREWDTNTAPGRGSGKGNGKGYNSGQASKGVSKGNGKRNGKGAHAAETPAPVEAPAATDLNEARQQEE